MRHLGQLMNFSITQAFEVGGKKQVDGIPSDRSRKVALQRRGELDHMGQKNFGMFGRLRHGEGIGQVEAEFFMNSKDCPEQ